MSKILLYSDLHCHMHKNAISRLDDCLKVQEWVFRTAIDRGIDTIIFGGDLFQDRQRIHVISYEKTFNLIRSIMTSYPNLQLYLLVGNHDMWYNDKWDISSISPLEAIPNVTVINKRSTIEVLPGYSMDFLPYTKNPVEDLLSFNTKSDVLVSHLAVDGAQLAGLYPMMSEVSVEHEGDMMMVDVNLFAGWKKVYLGHYHAAQQLNKVVEYIGSPLELNFGEAFQTKHIIEFDTETMESEYIVNDFSPKHLIIKEKNLDKFNLDGNFVQIVVEDITSTNIIDMRKEILKNSRTQTLEFKERKYKEKDITAGAKAEIKERFNFADGEILDRYIEAVGVGSLDREKLLSIGKQIVLEAE